MFKTASDFRLENHDNCNNPPVDHLVHYPGERLKTNVPTDQFDDDDDDDALEQLNGLGPAKQHHQHVDHVPNDQNVQHVDHMLQSEDTS